MSWPERKANPKYDVSDEVLDNLGATTTGRKGKNQPAPGGGTPSGGGQKGGDTGGTPPPSRDGKK